MTGVQTCALPILEAAKHRLVFEEFLILQLALTYLRAYSVNSLSGIAHCREEDLTTRFINKLPFSLTGAQKRVIEEVKNDMESNQVMQRLVQGDVGSGKTVIAAWALLKAVSGGYQGALMAPTEILAEQHFQTLQNWFQPLGIEVAFLKGSTPKNEKSRILQALNLGDIKVLVGTHALFQDDVEFQR